MFDYIGGIKMASMDNQQSSNQESGINAKDFLIGALIGGIVGATTALFLAPKSGKEMRQDLNTQAHNLKERTDHLREAAVTKGTEIAEVAKEKTTTIGQAVSKQSNEIISKVKNFKAAPVDGDIEEAPHTELENSLEEENDIQRKLEETKKAFDETELQLNQ